MAAGGSTARGGSQFDRAKLAQLCESEASGLRGYAQYLDNFKEQVRDEVNSEDRLQEIYQETAPATDAIKQRGTVRTYLVGNDLQRVGKRRRNEMEAAAVVIQRAYRTHRVRRRWLQLVSRMVKVGGASDSHTRLVPATLFDSFARSRHLTAAGRGAAAAGGSKSRATAAAAAPMEERLTTYRRSHELFHGDEFTRW